MPLIEQELLAFPEHLSSPSDPSGVRVSRFVVLSVYYVDPFLSFGTFSFRSRVVRSFSIYGF